MDDEVIHCSDFERMSFEKINSYITLLHQYKNDCVQRKKFIEAEMCSQRISQLTEIIEKKQKRKMIRQYTQEKLSLEKNNKESIKKIFEYWDKEIKQKEKQFKQEEAALREKHQLEIDERLLKFEKEDIEISKPNPKLIKLNHMLQTAVKLKQYTKAHQIQTEINIETKIEDHKFEEEKRLKFQFELTKLKQKHNNELLKFRIKTKNVIDNLNATKNEQIKKLEKREINVQNQITKAHNLKLNYFHKVNSTVDKRNENNKGLIRSVSECSRRPIKI